MAVYTASMVIGAVQAAIAITQSANRAFTQYQRDRETLIPGADVTALTFITSAEHLYERYRAIVSDDPGFVDQAPGLKEAYLALQSSSQTPAQEKLLNSILTPQTLQADQGAMSQRQINELASQQIIPQWDDKNPGKPLAPLETFALSFADVALGFIGSNPSILKVGGNGERLIGAFASTLSKLIPDNGDFGPRAGFANRIAGVVLRAGLETISKNPDLILSEEHLQDLIEGITLPIVKEFKEQNVSMTTQVKWQEVTDTLMSDAVSAAFETVAANQTAFLGGKFKTEKVVGAFTEQFLKIAAKDQLVYLFYNDDQNRPADTLLKEASLKLFKGALGVVAERPDLFIKGDNPDDVFLKNLLTNTGKLVQNHKGAFGEDLVTALAAEALDTLKANIPGLIQMDSNKAFEPVVQRSLTSILNGLSEGIQNDKGLALVLSHGQVVGLGRIFLEELARTPGMLGDGGKEFELVIAGVAKAMAHDKNLLLSGDDWMEIARVAAAEAAANPMRLFNVKEGDLGKQIAVNAITQILAATTTDLAAARTEGDVLFGDTLKKAITTTLRGIAGNWSKAHLLLKDENLTALSSQLNEIAKQTDDHQHRLYGSKEWLSLFAGALEKSLADGSFATLIENGQLTEDGQNLLKDVLLG